jgi:hypothetical protein
VLVLDANAGTGFACKARAHVAVGARRWQEKLERDELAELDVGGG